MARVAQRMCDGHVTSTSNDGTMAATVFAMSSWRSEARVWYAVDAVDVATRRRSGPSDIVREEDGEMKTPPVVKVCDAVQRVAHHGCARNKTTPSFGSLWCHMRFPHRLRTTGESAQLCPVQVHWTKQRITLRLSHFCSTPMGANGGAVPASVCAPFFVVPEERQAAEAIERLRLWIRSMASQVSRIHVHLLNHAGTVRRRLAGLPEQRSDVLQLHEWTYFEDANMSFDALANLDSSSSAVRATKVNPYKLHGMAQTKCLSEEYGSTEWMIILDIDEFWKALPPSPQLTAQQFLQRLPETRQTHVFCSTGETSCLRQPSSGFRSKSAYRISADRCHWLGGSHWSPPFGAQPAECAPARFTTQLRGTFLRFDGDAFSKYCSQAPVSYYIAHAPERIGTGHEGDCAFASRREWEFEQ